MIRPDVLVERPVGEAPQVMLEDAEMQSGFGIVAAQQGLFERPGKIGYLVYPEVTADAVELMGMIA